MQLLACPHQKPLKQQIVEAFRGEQRIGDALDRILVEIEAGGAEGEIEIDQRGGDADLGGQRPGEIVRDRGRTAAALGAGEGEHLADRLGFRRRVEIGDRLDHLHRVKRGHQVLADALADQFAIERDVVGAADHDDLGRRIADACQPLQLRHQRPGLGFA